MFFLCILSFFWALCSYDALVYGAAYNIMVDYEREYTSALKIGGGRTLYSPLYKPLTEEIEGIRKPSHIKIRLPHDLRRILVAHRAEKTPVSLAVACGDKELGARSRVASFYNASDRPNYSDFSENEDIFTSFLYEKLSENFISIDPILGIGKGYHADQRGAGHVIMDAQNTRHWEQLGRFFDKYNVKISQIIFTSIVSPEFMMMHKPRIFDVYMNLLKSEGRIVNPYFSCWSKECASMHCAFKRDLFSPKIQNQSDFVIDGFLGALFSSPHTGLFYESHASKTPLFSYYASFLRITQEWEKIRSTNIGDANEWLRRELLLRINEKCGDVRDALRDFILDTGMYYVSIFDMAALKSKEKLSSRRNFFKDTQEQQMRYLFPFYKKFYASFGYDIAFVTNTRVAKVLGIFDVVEAQKWQKGDYPLGERNHIALIIKKNEK